MLAVVVVGGGGLGDGGLGGGGLGGVVVGCATVAGGLGAAVVVGAGLPVDALVWLLVVAAA